MRAEKPGLTALYAQGTHTITAKGLFTFGAFDDGRNTRVQETGEGSVEKMGLNRLLFRFQLGNGDADGFSLFLDFDLEFGGAEAEDLAGFEDGFLDGLVIDECAVGGIEVADEDGVAADDEFAVETGYSGVMDTEIVCWIAAEADEAVGQLD